MKPGIKKVFDLWKTKNKIVDPYLKELNLDIIDQVASMFSSGSYYYYVINFETLAMDFVHNGTLEVLGIHPKSFTINKLLNIMHAKDVDKIHEKEATAIEFLLHKIAPEEIPIYKVVYLMRLQHSNGSYKTILHQTKALNISKDGKIHQVLGIHTDITHLNPAIDHKISFISNKLPSYFAIETKPPYLFKQNTFAALFTKREKEVIHLISQGKQASEIGTILFISIQTVNSHKKNILRKSHCKNTAQLITTCIREGVI